MKQTLGNTGDAPIVRVGHTANDRFGTEPNAQVKGGAGKPRDITFGK